MSGERQAVWCVWVHGDDGRQVLRSVHATYTDAHLAVGEVEDLAGVWWTIRQHYLGDVVKR